MDIVRIYCKTQSFTVDWERSGKPTSIKLSPDA
jgi:hypothetical protein